MTIERVLIGLALLAGLAYAAFQFKWMLGM